jgi:uncharacterized repeat protein (TIGR01451 family)
MSVKTDLAVLAWLLTAASAFGEVTLDTEVAKVASTLGDNGRVQRELVPVEEVVPGEELRYTIKFTNASETPVDAERIIITNPIPDGTRYVPGSAGGDDARVEYSADGENFSSAEPADVGSEPPGSGTEPASASSDPAGGASGAGFTADGEAAAAKGLHSLRWTYQQDLPPGRSSEVFFHVRMQ